MDSFCIVSSEGRFEFQLSKFYIEPAVTTLKHYNIEEAYE